jgi:cell wall-associated NlpC family hydrolase
MAKRKHRHRRQRDGVIGPALRPVAWSALLGAAMAGAAITPAAANPPAAPNAQPGLPDRVPDEGARPQPAGPLQMPGAGGVTSTAPIAPVTSPGLGPLAMQITALETEVASLGEQLKTLAIDRQQIEVELESLTTAWRDAVAELHSAETAAESAAEEAYKSAAGLPPGAIDSDLHGLGALSRLQPERPAGSEAEALRLKRAREVERAAYLAYSDAMARQGDAGTRYTGLQTTFKAREQALLDLRRRNASQLATIEQEREAREQQLAAGFLGGDTVDGLQAATQARKAVQFALAQLGEPYLWGAEGPSRWDCSGLMWGAYRSVGVTLPRVSRDQYQATKTRAV